MYFGRSIAFALPVRLKPMETRFLSSVIVATALAFTGCATKKYVVNTTTPIKGQVDTVQAQVNQQGQKIDQQGNEINQQKQQIDDQATGLSATNERAVSADQRAGDALNRADQA